MAASSLTSFHLTNTGSLSIEEAMPSELSAHALIKGLSRLYAMAADA
eukprot:CAMPEP_0114121372 /NCGR_PEP_ID=MMETSP0043_2-20121206/7143_1 /TAXON_ID=464988 /ORGANISM="Hemiselmis andersenii, Strain CCMP644" /LENGTH=46 /DNA_ID= /DNA_START= /DNA_END= /DNA_ORIENTATION=